MGALESLYQELILDHAKRKVGSGLAEVPAGSASATSHQRNPICGDEVTVQVVLGRGRGDGDGDGDGDRVAGLTWEGLGCSISQASSSMLADLVVGDDAPAEGLSAAEVARLTAGFREVMRSKGTLTLDEEEFGDAAALSGVSRFTARVKCAMLPWVALEDAVARAHRTG